KPGRCDRDGSGRARGPGADGAVRADRSSRPWFGRACPGPRDRRFAGRACGRSDPERRLMAEQKPGFLKRLFGDAPAPAPDEAPGPPETLPPAAMPKASWFQRLTGGLKRSSDQIATGLASVFTKKK